jgi:hypothetical protein
MLDYNIPMPIFNSNRDGKYIVKLRELISAKPGLSTAFPITEDKEVSIRNSLNRAIKKIDKDRLKMARMIEDGKPVFRVWKVLTEREKFDAYR